MATPRPPGVSLCDLMLQGLLSEGDFLPGGKVDDNVRIRAEVQYASFLTQHHPQPMRRPTRPPTPVSQPLPTRPLASTPRHRPASRRPMPRVPPHPQTARRHRPLPQSTHSTHIDQPSSCPPPPAPLSSTQPHSSSTSLLTQSLGPRACCICQTNEKTHAPLPCFHMCMCETCSVRVEACPLCRTPIVSLHRIYT